MTLIDEYENLRQRVKAAILPLLPKEQTYVNLRVPFVAGIKYLGPGTGVGFSTVFAGEVVEYNLEAWPLDSLVRLLEQLQSR